MAGLLSYSGKAAGTHMPDGKMEEFKGTKGL